jgi:hypothetical protein
VKRYWKPETPIKIKKQSIQILESLFFLAKDKIQFKNNVSIENYVKRLNSLFESKVLFNLDVSALKVSIEEKSILIEAQQHICSVFNRIYDNSEYLWEVDIFENSCRSVMKLNPYTKTFNLIIFPLYDKKEPQLERIKHTIDIILINLINGLNFEAHRFKKCDRCNAFFYQPTAREKVFCSDKCANAIRQKKFRTRRKEKKNSKKK